MVQINLPGQQIPMDKVTHHILSRSKMMEISFLRADTVRLYGWQEENICGQIPLRFSNSGANKFTNHPNKLTNHLNKLIYHLNKLTNHLNKLTTPLNKLTNHLNKLINHLNNLTNHLNKLTNHLKLMILCTINRSLVKTNHFFLKMVLFTLNCRYFI